MPGHDALAKGKEIVRELLRQLVEPDTVSKALNEDDLFWLSEAAPPPLQVNLSARDVRRPNLCHKLVVAHICHVLAA